MPGSGDRPGVSSDGKFSGGKVERNLCHPLSSRIQKEDNRRADRQTRLNRILVRASPGKEGGSTNLSSPRGALSETRTKVLVKRDFSGFGSSSKSVQQQPFRHAAGV